MKIGYLSDYFKGVANKALSQVEANILKSNQHEYNGDKGLKVLLGTSEGRKQLDTSFMYIGDDEVFNAIGRMTWYDARENNPNRSEWRLYFPTNDVTNKATVGDSFYLCRMTDDKYLVIIAQKDSTIDSQLKWLFDIGDNYSDAFNVKEDFNSDKNQIEYVSRLILEQIGVQYETDEAENYLEEMLSKFSGEFPTTKEFSKYAKETLINIEPVENPDEALLLLVNREESLFRALEKHLIAERLAKGFVSDDKVDVDGFVAYSLSVQNRRKSRVGQAFENHIEYLLIENNIEYSRTKVTENRSKPDFLFPGIEAYKDTNYKVEYLTVLGVKSTCKDRWRQVLAEADRIEKKHLLTLEAAISEYQTDEMKAKNLQLILPKDIHSTYNKNQQSWLFTVDDFLKEVKEKQQFYKING